MLICSGMASAQSTGAGTQPGLNRTGSIRGRVLMPNGRPVSEPIKVTLRQLRGDRSISYTDSDGGFEIGGLIPSFYTVEVEADRERKYEPNSERVEVYPSSPTIVVIYLKEKSDESKEKAAETVSVSELEQSVPSGAKREFERGSRAGLEGKTDEAVDHLRKALAIYPEYLKARNDLGTYLLSQGKLDEAADELRAAIKIDPKAFNPRLNLGMVLVKQHEFQDAAASLEMALTLDARSPAAHLYAGLAHLGLNETDRAEKEFSTAYELGGGGEYALAQFHLGHLYMDKGERALALKAFETYLRDKPDAVNAEQVRRLIGMLR
jgi:Tfp pilus assembly protein PilF